MTLVEQWMRFNHWLVRLRERRIPQAFVLVSGLGSFGVGLLFQAVPDRLSQTEALHTLTSMLDPRWWAVMFFLFGTTLAVLAVARYHWSAPVSFLHSVLMFWFCILCGVDVLNGPAAGLLALMAFLLGLVNVLTCLMAVAPLAERIADG